MSIVVTGAGGYVGGRLVDHLRHAGETVWPMVRRDAPWILQARRPIDLVTVDMDTLVGRLEGHDAVVHLAGANEVVFGRDPDRALADTVVATQRLAQAARRAGVPRFVYLSTIHVYGGRTDDGVVHEGIVPEPRHPYAIARLAGEHLAAGLGPDHVVSLRLTNAVGYIPDRRIERGTLVANELCARAIAGEPLVLRSSGHDLRDFVAMEDACRVIGAAAAGALPTGTYNLGSGTSTRIIDLAHLVADAAEENHLRRPEVVAPPHEGPEPAPFRVDVGRLAAHVPPPATDLRATLATSLFMMRPV